MILVEKPLGNADDPTWAGRLEGATVDPLPLDQWQAQKNRFRLKSEGGVEIAAALDRNTHLRDGDILVWDEATRTAVVARVSLNDVMRLHLDELLAKSPEDLARACVELGHALGNQHWPAVMKGMTVYVPLTVDIQFMASVMRTHAFAGVTVECVPGSEVIPYLAPHESRRLFGGAEASTHSHARALAANGA
ncbi:urease accessory protein UreE, partial [Singulisphaera rosea]